MTTWLYPLYIPVEQVVELLLLSFFALRCLFSFRTLSNLFKSTHTDKYLDFRSHHPLAHKVAVARTLFHRAEKICTDFPEKEKEKKHVT